jgi:hypothetical protein
MGIAHWWINWRLVSTGTPESKAPGYDRMISRTTCVYSGEKTGFLDFIAFPEAFRLSALGVVVLEW